MRCFHPIDAWQSEKGARPVFVDNGGIRLTLRCGQCIGCRLNRSRQWAIRCVHERQMHANSSFITLTYDQSHVRLDGSLEYRDFQLFLKRLRHQFWYVPIRFFMAGEYGEDFSRPHFHACIFGVMFSDRRFHKSLSSGFKLYRSPTLEKLWPFGFSSVGDVTAESAGYVARYVVKKVTGPGGASHYLSDHVDDLTGEVVVREPEFCRMSLKPGIGAPWFAKYGHEVFPRDYVVVGGQKVRPPKFYDKLLAASSDFPLATPLDVEYSRYLLASEMESDNGPERLAVQEAVAKARLSFKKRSITT